MSAPRLLLCAPASGGGKTTVTCALLQALVNRGAGPVAFKCGPDYIDPMFHSEIIGAKSRNLDLFFLGRDTARYLLEKNSRGSGLALIEGVMGYYDGIGLSADASAYDLARATGTPAVQHQHRRGAGDPGDVISTGFFFHSSQAVIVTHDPFQHRDLTVSRPLPKKGAHLIWCTKETVQVVAVDSKSLPVEQRIDVVRTTFEGDCLFLSFLQGL